jgi:hypothetical protein
LTDKNAAFVYDYAFTLTQAGIVQGTVTLAGLAKFLPTIGTIDNEKNTVWELYAGANPPSLHPSPFLEQSFLALSIGGASAGFTTGLLAAGTYYAEFEGVSLSNRLTPSISIATSAIPEMSTWAMLGLGLLGLGFVGTRKRETARIAA